VEQLSVGFFDQPAPVQGRRLLGCCFNLDREYGKTHQKEAFIEQAFGDFDRKKPAIKAECGLLRDQVMIRSAEIGGRL